MSDWGLRSTCNQACTICQFGLDVVTILPHTLAQGEHVNAARRTIGNEVPLDSRAAIGI